MCEMFMCGMFMCGMFINVPMDVMMAHCSECG